MGADTARHRAREYAIDDGPIDPITGAAGALMGTATSMMMGIADMPVQTLKMLHIHPDSKEARAAKKGKGKANSDDTSSTGESARTGRPSVERTTTNTTDASVTSNASTPPVQPLPASTGKTRSSTDNAPSPSPGTPGTPGAPSHRSSFMSQAFAETAQRSRSPSRDRMRKHGRASSTSAAELHSKNGTASTGPGLAENCEFAVDTGKGLARIIGAGFKSPMDFSLNVAKGLHNVPKLYGADVRQVDKVTDFQSGIRTAAKVCFDTLFRCSLLTITTGVWLRAI
jgi:hypothetical protein